MTDKNPIEMEIDKLSDQWNEFIDSKQPILRWLIDPDANQLAFTFVKIQEEFDEDTRDLFISLYSDFSNPERYGKTLADELNLAVVQGLQELSGEDEKFNWQIPELAKARSGYDALIKSGQAVIDAFGAHFENLVLVITPVNLKDGKGYLHWWSQVCQVHRDYQVWPKNLKFLVFDNARAPTFSATAKDFPKQICSLAPPLNLRNAINRVLSEADDGSPGAKFRQLFVDLNYAVQEGELPAIKNTSQQALDLAGKHEWYDMWVSVLMLRAAGLLNLKYPEQALEDYRVAQRYAQMGVEQNKVGCDKLLLQALFSEGSALLSLGDYQKAAPVYKKSALLAEQQGDAMLCMDGWRMEAFCYEQLKQKDTAWESACHALEAARKIDPELLPNTTINYVGEALIRVAPSQRQRQQAEEALASLLGPDWREQGKQEAIT